MEQKARQIVSITKLTEAGVQVGLSPRKWNPQMRSFIKGRKGNSHIFDLEKTNKILELAYKLVFDVTAKKGKILIVGTKGKTIKQIIKDEAKRMQASFVIQRWLGGTLTNYKQINNSVQRLNDLINLDKTGEITKYPKKEQIQLQKEIEKLIKFVGGISNMRGMPDLMIIIDPKSEMNAVHEAKKMGIPTIGLTNSNGSPDDTSLTLPVNTLSPRAVNLIMQILADAACEPNNLPLLVTGRPDEEIVLMEEKRPLSDGFAKTGHKSFWKFNNAAKNNKKNLDEKTITKPASTGI